MLTDVMCVPSNFYLWRPAAVWTDSFLVEIIYHSLRKHSQENDHHQGIIQDTLYQDHIFYINHALPMAHNTRIFEVLLQRESEWIPWTLSSHQELRYISEIWLHLWLTKTMSSAQPFLQSLPGEKAFSLTLPYWTTEPSWFICFCFCF